MKVRSEEERHSMERKVHLMVEEAERRQQRYRKKMDKEAAMYMDDA